MSKARRSRAAPAPAAALPVAVPLGQGELRLEWWPVAKVRRYNRNAKRHPPEQVAQLAQSIAEHGWTQPLLVRSDGELVAGHGRLDAAESLGFEVVPVVVRDDLTAEQAKALRISDNRLAELGSWDKGVLQSEIDELRQLDMDVTGLGFSDDELKGIEADVARELAKVEQQAGPLQTAARAPTGAGLGQPVIAYQLVFDNDEQQGRWFEFIRSLRTVYPKLGSVAARLDAWVAASLNPTQP